MFTGIIRHIGGVRRVEEGAGGISLTIDVGPLAEGLRAGDSVAVSGACLTATTINRTEAQFDVVAQTLSLTTLGGLRAGSDVNLERSLRLGQGLDGHLVQGHVDGMAKVRSVRSNGAEYMMEFSAGTGLTELMVPQGSVAIDGVSLTLVDVRGGGFTVALIPTTLKETTLGRLKAGMPVNVEADIIGKYVRKYLGALAPV